MPSAGAPPRASHQADAIKLHFPKLGNVAGTPVKSYVRQRENNGTIMVKFGACHLLCNLEMCLDFGVCPEKRKENHSAGVWDLQSLVEMLARLEAWAVTNLVVQ
jgi:hypothetical protein